MASCETRVFFLFHKRDLHWTVERMVVLIRPVFIALDLILKNDEICIEHFKLFFSHMIKQKKKYEYDRTQTETGGEKKSNINTE